ncbi:MAG: TRAP transporter substrate-binding protein [Betaproteobacteria bacterium]|nr:MAG: TRAP transporter substrate-binding protein [Betaproteobacteria bacterium]
MRLAKPVLAAALAASACLAQAQQFTMKLSTPTVGDVTVEWMNRFKAGVEKRSGGRIKVEIYPGSQLGQIPRTVEGVALGTMEMTVPAVGFFVGLEPRFQVFDAPGLFDSVEHAQKVFADPDIRKRLSSFGAAKGVEPLFTFANGPLMLLSHRPVRRVEDLQGLKIRVPGGTPLHTEPFRRLGASPLSMPLGEVMPAMQNKAIDGFTAALVVFVAFKYYDVTKHLTELPGSFLIASGLVNRSFMKSLGGLEPMVREEARKAEDAFVHGAIADVNRLRGAWQKNGGEIIQLPPAEAPRYLQQATSALPAILSADRQLREDYDALVAAAQRNRR